MRREQSERIHELLARGADEVVTAEELQAMAAALAAGEPKKGYIGFEPSGRVHLGWTITANKIVDFVEAGVDMTILLADWHAYINDKMGGSMEAIQACGRYMQDTFAALGVPRHRVRFLYASDYISDAEYWQTVIKVAKSSSLARIRRAMDIMGRAAEEGDKDFSKFIYPNMQVADILYHGFDLAYGGLDQRHAHMLARDVAEKLKMKKPVAIHTPLLPGLKAAGRMDPLEAKMSKSDPDSAILVHDAPEDVTRKIQKALCPEKETNGNPVLAIAKHILFPHKHRLATANTDKGLGSLIIERPAKFGGKLEFKTYPDLEAQYAAGKLHPADLKTGVAQAVNEILDPVRKYFVEHPENLERMKQFQVTR